MYYQGYIFQNSVHPLPYIHEHIKLIYNHKFSNKANLMIRMANSTLTTEFIIFSDQSVPNFSISISNISLYPKTTF
jgi:hypothetical protein